MSEKILYASGTIISPDNRVLITSQDPNTLNIGGKVSISLETHVPYDHDAGDEIEAEILVYLGNSTVTKLKLLTSFETLIQVGSLQERRLKGFIYKLKEMCTFRLYDPTQLQLAFIHIGKLHSEVVTGKIKLTTNSLSILNYLTKNISKCGE